MTICGTETFGEVRKRKGNLTERQAKKEMIEKVKEVFGSKVDIITPGEIEFDENCGIYKLPVHTLRLDK